MSKTVARPSLGELINAYQDGWDCGVDGRSTYYMHPLARKAWAKGYQRAFSHDSLPDIEDQYEICYEIYLKSIDSDIE